MSPRTLGRVGGALLAVTAAAPILTACGGPDPQSQITGTSWQITELYLEPGTPSTLPDLVAGRASLIFGEHSVAGSTGCAPIQGQVTFTADGEVSAARDADRVSFDRTEIEVPADGCVGQAMFTHERISGLLTGEFEIARLSDYELALTQVSDEIDPPAIHLSSDRVPEQPED
ncbi:hypothetical protein [Corynebacterium halotolerans]|uniref:hypothetical protein n=1 Tax=Corynebacterium halotolerans TaxID=225326 RepID=UPI003CF6BD60